jgi:hypothetical protein
MYSSPTGCWSGRWIGKLIERRRAPNRPFQRLTDLRVLLGQQAKLPERESHAASVPEFFADGERLAVPVLGDHVPRPAIPRASSASALTTEQ